MSSCFALYLPLIGNDCHFLTLSPLTPHPYNMPTLIKSYWVLLLFTGIACKRAAPSPPAAAPLPAEVAYRQAAEFEPMEAVWLLWSPYGHKQGFSNEQVTLDILTALVPHVRVKLVVPNDSVRQLVQRRVPADWLEYGKVNLYTLPYNEFWARDMGPVFVRSAKGLAMADFSFNGWGTSTEQDPLQKENEQLDEKTAALLQLPVVSSKVISEGGDREVNGKGVLIASEVVEQGRNPDLSLAEIAAEFKRLLGASKVIWLKQGLYEDDHTHRGPIQGPKGQQLYTVLTTNGHVDEYCRFADARTLLLAAVDSSELADDPISRENAKRLEINHQILKQATDQDGHPFRIVRVPLPYPVIDKLRPGDGVYDLISQFEYLDGSTFPKGKPINAIAAASYLNFLIANEVVLMPKYARPGSPPAVARRDAEAQTALAGAFPGKKIIAIDALAINWGGGGIHCITANEPTQ